MKTIKEWFEIFTGSQDSITTSFKRVAELIRIEARDEAELAAYRMDQPDVARAINSAFKEAEKEESSA